VRRALIVQTEPDGPAGLVADRLAQHGYEQRVVQILDATSTHSDVVFPDPTGFDVVVPLGSVHSVYDVDTIGSWVDREVATVRAAHDAGVPVFGICFGAQVLCSALGGDVERSPKYELGWTEVDSDDHDIVPPGPWFAWHGDRCVLPPGVTELARNDVATQAFAHGSSFAVQFHPEVTRDIVAGWIAKVPRPYFEQRGVDPANLLDRFDDLGDRTDRNLGRMLDRFLETHVGGRAPTRERSP
jgi:GMP synthase-like glutamine amidotransferase